MVFLVLADKLSATTEPCGPRLTWLTQILRTYGGLTILGQLNTVARSSNLKPSTLLGMGDTCPKLRLPGKQVAPRVGRFVRTGKPCSGRVGVPETGSSPFITEQLKPDKCLA